LLFLDETMKSFVLIAFALFLCSGCHTFQPRISGSGVAQSEYRPVPWFNQIELSGFGTVNVVGGQSPSVQVTTDDNLLCWVGTEVENGKLHIETTRNIRPRTELIINVTVPELVAAQVSGAGDLNVDGVVGQQLELAISGAGDLRASGQVNQVTATISGAGSADLQQLYAENADVRISGAGDIDVFATQSVKAHVSGAGSVNCYGNPADVQQEVRGAGSIRLR
jgi:hypothetical protein